LFGRFALSLRRGYALPSELETTVLVLATGEIAIQQESESVHEQGLDRVLAWPTLLAVPASLKKHRLRRRLFRLAKIAQTDTRKPVTLTWSESHSFTQL